MYPLEDDELYHYGVPRRSGRYPWGSGENPYQRSGDFLARVNELKKSGMNDTAIAKEMGLTTTQFRAQKSLANAERRQLEVDQVKSMKSDGLSNAEIARRMGKNESTIRSLLNENSEARMNQAQKTADFLKKQVDEKGMIDVGAGVERELGISREKMKQALYMLEREGYEVYGGGVPQATNPGKQTNLQVLCPPGTEHKEIYNYKNINSIRDYHSSDDGETFRTFQYPKSLDSKRVAVRYAEDGGKQKDGLIEIRRGVDDLTLGNSHYAQVRILLDGKKYMKGMAVYSDDLPDGVDVVFNTNKTKATSKMEVFKDIKDDPDNPFGSLITAAGQTHYTDKNGKSQLSPINKTREEGEWLKWSDGLPSQFLSKQSQSLAKRQLKLAVDDKKAELKDINALTNPTIKKKLLDSFANDCDSAAVHLQAAALPRQKYHVILPVPSLKDTEVYAPNYNNGEKLALIRYPHGGTFEIPILTVNNKHAASKKLLGNSPADAIAINSKNAERLSGADFDGDTVMCIPVTSRTRITSTKPLEGLKDFDPKLEYGTVKKGNDYYNSKGEKIKVMKNTQNEMGRISNLITDMTIKGATPNELARAVRHSMVVIDAEKHKLDYKTSEKDNNIASLKKKYQGAVDADGKYHEGASTIISRAKSETQVIKRQGQPRINQKGKSWYDPSKPEGALIYKEVVETYTDKKGKTKTRTQKSTKMAETDDAFTLVSELNGPMERTYAEYANAMKSLANQARKEMVYTPRLKMSSTAKETYKEEVKHLKNQLDINLKNAPKERRAQLLAKSEVDAKKEDNPGMTKEEVKKASQQALTKYRNQLGAKRYEIEISDREWEAIQAGAISENVLNQILDRTNMDDLRQRATPRSNKELSQAKINRISSMKALGYTTAEIARALGVSSTTVSNHLNQ